MFSVSAGRSGQDGAEARETSFLEQLNSVTTTPARETCPRLLDPRATARGLASRASQRPRDTRTGPRVHSGEHRASQKLTGALDTHLRVCLRSSR